MYYVKNKNKDYKSNELPMTMAMARFFSRIPTTTCTRPSSSTRSKVENYKSKLKNYDNWLEREMQR